MKRKTLKSIGILFGVATPVTFAVVYFKDSDKEKVRSNYSRETLNSFYKNISELGTNPIIADKMIADYDISSNIESSSDWIIPVFFNKEKHDIKITFKLPSVRKGEIGSISIGPYRKKNGLFQINVIDKNNKESGWTTVTEKIENKFFPNYGDTYQFRWALPDPNKYKWVDWDLNGKIWPDKIDSIEFIDPEIDGIEVPTDLKIWPNFASSIDGSPSFLVENFHNEKLILEYQIDGSGPWLKFNDNYNSPGYSLPVDVNFGQKVLLRWKLKNPNWQWKYGAPGLAANLDFSKIGISKWDIEEPHISIEKSDNKKNRGVITINSRHYDNVTLQFKLDGYTGWFNVINPEYQLQVIPGVKYHFRWLLNDPKKTTWGLDGPPKIESIKVDNIVIDKLRNLNIVSTMPNNLDDNGILSISSYPDIGAVLQYKIDSSEFKNVPFNGIDQEIIGYGKEVSFKWKFMIPASKWIGEVPKNPGTITFDIKKEIKKPTNPGVNVTYPRHVYDKGIIKVDDYIGNGAKLQYQISDSTGTEGWVDLPETNSKEILVGFDHTIKESFTRKVEFRWKLIDDKISKWENENIPNGPEAENIKRSNKRIVQVPEILITKEQPLFSNDKGYFTVPEFKVDGAILQYKITSTGKWNKVFWAGDKKIGVDSGKKVYFRWEISDPSKYAWKNDSRPKAPESITFDTPTYFGVDTPSVLFMTQVQPSYKGDSGYLSINHYENNGAMLKYKLNSAEFKPVPFEGIDRETIPFGTKVSFKWELENSKSKWRNGKPKTPLSITFTSSKNVITKPIGPDPIKVIQPTYKDQKGFFSHGKYEVNGAKLQYKIDGFDWEDSHWNGLGPIGVDRGKSVKFRWRITETDKWAWKNGIPEDAPGEIIFNNQIEIGINKPDNPKIKDTQPISKNNNGSFEVPKYEAPGAVLVYIIDGNETDVPKSGSGPITIGYNKTVSFKWKLENENSIWKSGKTPDGPRSKSFTSDKTSIKIPEDIKIKSKKPAYIKDNTGTFEVPKYEAPGAVLVYIIDGVETDVKEQGSGPISVDYGKKVSFEWRLFQNSNTIWEDGKEPKKIESITFDSNVKGIMRPKKADISIYKPLFKGMIGSLAINPYDYDGASIEYKIDKEGSSFKKALKGNSGISFDVPYGNSVSYRWALDKPGESVWIDGEKSLDTKSVSFVSNIEAPTLPKIIDIQPPFEGENGYLEVKSYDNKVAILQYKVDGTSADFKDIPKTGLPRVEIGFGKTVLFQWRLNSKNTFAFENNKIHNQPWTIIFTSNKIGIDAKKIIDVKNLVNHNKDGFSVSAYKDNGAVLQYKVDDQGNFIDIPLTGLKKVNIDYGKSLLFKWRLKDRDKSAWISGNSPVLLNINFDTDINKRYDDDAEINNKVKINPNNNIILIISILAASTIAILIFMIGYKKFKKFIRIKDNFQ